MHESAFEIDDNIAIYDGYTDGTHWNGWACPWFTKETALEIADAHWENIYEDGYIITNPELAAKLLPTQSGFFFGGTDYDEYYMEDVKYTFELLPKIISETDFDKQVISYRSSW